MNLKSNSSLLLGVLFLSFLQICIVSCSKSSIDDPEFHLKLSESTCEVMQGRRVVIDLTATENTTLDIKNSDLIDVQYAWEFGNNKSKIEITGKQKGETDIVITDHKTGESATIKVKVTQYPMPHLGVKQTEVTILEMMDFYLYNNSSMAISLNELSIVCDSIVWAIDGQSGSIRMFEHKSGEGMIHDHLSLKWGHCFKHPGDYKTHLTAWKDNKITFYHHQDITITDNKDFLRFNWRDITKNSQEWEGYADLFNSSPNLITSYGLNGNVPFVEARIFNSEFPQIYPELFNYFSKLYSTPKYEDKTDRQQMGTLYDELFSKQKSHPNGYPVAIWVAERANIVLLLLDGDTDNPDYVIYAEPIGQ